MAGSNVPYTTETGKVDLGFQEQVNWFKTHLGINDPAGIQVTVVVDGVPYQGWLTAAQLLGNNLSSVLQLCGVVDLTDSHSLVLIVSCS